MPFTIITLRNVPPSLRGDLSKWMQEISTGVFVGNFNVKVREQLWERVKASVSNGEATISYSYRNEIGYQFETIGTQRQVIDSDGIPLVLIPGDEQHSIESVDLRSDASKFHQAKKYASIRPVKSKTLTHIILDIETDGLDEDKHAIIEIAALKLDNLNIDIFHRLIRYEGVLPDNIIELTGITTEMLRDEGVPITQALEELEKFCGDYLIAGYNIKFDMGFINNKFSKLFSRTFTNETIDLLRMVRKEKIFLANYKLKTVLESYGIDNNVQHRALEDVKVIHELSLKLNEFQRRIKAG